MLYYFAEDDIFDRRGKRVNLYVPFKIYVFYLQQKTEMKNNHELSFDPLDPFEKNTGGG